MTGLITLITDRFHAIDLTNLYTDFDLLVALAIVLSFLWYIKRFPVFRVVLGTFFLMACSFIFLLAGLTFTALVFGITSNLILISLPLIFAPEIRHYLEKLGRFEFLRVPSVTEKQKNREFIRNLVDAAEELAEEKIGATIVLRRKTGLAQTVETGIFLDSEFSSKLLTAIFQKYSPLHDGAVVIKNRRILAATCLLPISGEIKLDKKFGTRHRSGLAITKDTDAVVIIVSEQRGEITLAENNKWHNAISKIELMELLNKLL